MNQRSNTAHSTIVVGAGNGVGLAVARRFSRTGGGVGLIARSPDRLEEMAATLRADGVTAAFAPADATDPVQLRAAIRGLVDHLGPVDVLCFSPLPAVDLIKPVLETQAHDFMASLALSVGGAASAVSELVPGMIARGRGSLLFTTGSGAIRPLPARAASAVATTAETAYISLLHQELEPAGVRVAHLVIAGAIGAGATHEPARVADALWAAHESRGPSVTVMR